VPPDDFGAPAIDREDSRHLEGVEDDRGDGARPRDEPDPESGGDVERQERAEVVPEGVADLVHAEQFVQEKQGHERDEGEETQVRHQERKAHQQRETGGQEPESAFGIFVGRGCHVAVNQ